MEGSSKARSTCASASTVRRLVRNAVSLSASCPIAATSTYSTTACVSFLGLYCAARRSRRSSGTLAIPRCASRGLEWPRLDTSTLVRILNSDVLPTCGRPMIPVFIVYVASLQTAKEPRVLLGLFCACCSGLGAWSASPLQAVSRWQLAIGSFVGSPYLIVSSEQDTGRLSA